MNGTPFCVSPCHFCLMAASQFRIASFLAAFQRQRHSIHPYHSGYLSARHSLDVAFLAGETKQTAFYGTALLNRDGHIKKSRKPSMERVSDMPVVREIA